MAESMTCQWCGDRHGVDQLCQRAQRGMTRRSFCFLFGAGIAGAMLATSSYHVRFTKTERVQTRVYLDAGYGEFVEIADRCVAGDGTLTITEPVDDLIRGVLRREPITITGYWDR